MGRGTSRASQSAYKTRQWSRHERCLFFDPIPRNSFTCSWLLATFANRAMMVSKFTSTEGPVTMPTRNVNLTDELDRFVAKKVKTGRYENASEVVRAGLRTLEREEQQYEAKLAEGDASGVAEGDVLGRVRKAL